MEPNSAAIVIPTFNRSKFVKKAIDTSLAQTHPCQVIVCDHGSTDETPAVVSAYGKEICYIRRERDLGPHFCWLEGVLNTDAEFIHIQFDDDWIADTFIERALDLMNNQVGIVFSNAGLVDLESGTEIKTLKFFEDLNTGVYPNKLLEKKLINQRRMVSPGACLLRKKDIVDALYQGNLPINENDTYHGVGPDYWMSIITLLRYHCFGFINEPLAFFGYHAGSITIDSKTSKDKQKKIRKAYKSVRTFYRVMKIGKSLNKVVSMLTR